MRKLSFSDRYYGWVKGRRASHKTTYDAYMHGIAVGRAMVRRKLKRKIQRMKKLQEDTYQHNRMVMEEICNTAHAMRQRNTFLEVQLYHANNKITELVDRLKEAGIEI